MELDNEPETLPGFGRMQLHAERRLSSNNDIKIIIQGDNSQTGIGKTTLAIQICKRIDPDWTAEERSFVDIQDYINAYLDSPKGSALLLDEVEAGADSRRAMSEENVKLSQAWAQLRARNIATVCTLPSVSMLDNRLLELSDYWVLVKQRGVAQPYRVQVNNFNQNIQRRGLGPEQSEHILFDDLPDDDSDKRFLDKLKDEMIQRGSMQSIPIEEHEAKLQEEREKARQDYRDEALRCLVKETDLTLREIAELEIVSVSRQRVGQIANSD